MSTIRRPKEEIHIARRPGLGIQGAQHRIVANFYRISKIPERIVSHYDVTIVPEVPTSINRKVWQKFGESSPLLMNIHAVYDGRKNVFSPEPLFPEETRSFNVDLSDGHRPANSKASRNFIINLKRVANIDMTQLNMFLKGGVAITNSCLTAIMVLDVVIGHQPSMLHTTVGRSFFPDPKGNQPKKFLPQGLEIWGGWHQSARPTPGNMMINLDVSATVFHQSGELLMVCCNILGQRELRELNETQRLKLEKALRSVKITVSYRGEPQASRKYKIFKLTQDGANNIKFTANVGTPNQTTQTITQYFQRQYNIRLAYPNLPCLVVSTAHNTFLPMELCKIVPGQRYMRKLTREQTKEMITFTSQPPSARLTRIGSGVELLSWENNPYLRDFGLVVDKKPVETEARILRPPKVEYFDNGLVPEMGVWNLRNRRVATGATLGSWGIAVFHPEVGELANDLRGFIQVLVTTFMETGMHVVMGPSKILYCNPMNVKAELGRVYSQTGAATKVRPQILVCILPDTGASLYAEIKRIGDTDINVPTQCMQINNLAFPKAQYCANVCLKVNLKLGGMNSYINPKDIRFIAETETIVFGADVTHPSPGDTKRPSIAALCASLDSKASRYSAIIRMQKARVEIINELEKMVVSLLKKFKDFSGRLPKRILFYRDGVSEGQFKEVLDKEINAIKDACHGFHPTYTPPITFVVVQKRHHTRFFKTTGNGPKYNIPIDKKGNLQPGVVVDQTVIHPFQFDFYLQAHAGLNGTCRPTHYYVLYDENKFTADALQGLTYNLCYIYGRATRSVSVVPPAYYADLVATRARCHFQDSGFSETDPTNASENERPIIFGQIDESMVNSMYFI